MHFYFFLGGIVVGFAFWICIAYGSDTTALKMPAQYSVILLGGISGKNSLFGPIFLENKFIFWIMCLAHYIFWQLCVLGFLSLWIRDLLYDVFCLQGKTGKTKWKINKLLRNIFVTLSPKTTKNEVTKMGWNAHRILYFWYNFFIFFKLENVEKVFKGGIYLWK